MSKFGRLLKYNETMPDGAKISTGSGPVISELDIAIYNNFGIKDRLNKWIDALEGNDESNSSPSIAGSHFGISIETTIFRNLRLAISNSGCFGLFRTPFLQ